MCLGYTYYICVKEVANLQDNENRFETGDRKTRPLSLAPKIHHHVHKNPLLDPITN
jgi:hypothetical protein